MAATPVTLLATGDGGAADIGSNSPRSLILRAACMRAASRAIRSSPMSSSMPALSGAIPCGRLNGSIAPHDWTERTQAYLDGAGALFVEAARGALDRAGLRAQDVDVVVTVSSTGIATPSLEARVAADMGFRPSAMRVPVFGLGCAGGVSGLSLGARLARAEPGEIVLVVVVELCTLAFRNDRSTKADVISSALFGDGAAAAVLRAELGEAPLPIGASAEHTWPGTLDIMGWSIDPIGFGVVLSRSLPRFRRERLAAPARRFVKSAHIDAPQFVLSSGRRQGARGDRDGARIAEGHAARRARGACAATATCRRRACCSCSSARSSAVCADRRCSRRSAPDSPRAFLRSRLAHDPEKWDPVFGNDHAQGKCNG